MILVSSNQKKINEFKNYFPDLIVQTGKDIKEVLGTKEEVIMYKSLEAGNNYVVEDTIVEVDGKELVEIRWKKNSLVNGQKIRWITSLGYYKDDKIYVYQGIIDGVVVTDRLDDRAFGFDDVFVPNGIDKTLFELELIGIKGDYSARKFALQSFRDNDYKFCYNIKDIPQWNGQYQNQ